MSSSRPATSAEARLQGLRRLARQIFLNRWGGNMKESHRPAIARAARPYFRAALTHLHRSRAALVAGDLAVHECERDRARMNYAFALLEFAGPSLKRSLADQQRARQLSSAGGIAKATNSDKADALKQLDLAIAQALDFGDVMTRAAWADQFKVSLSTVDRHIVKARDTK